MKAIRKWYRKMMELMHTQYILHVSMLDSGKIAHHRCMSFQDAIEWIKCYDELHVKFELTLI